MIQSCQECGRCCMNTEMILSADEIKIILHDSSIAIEESDFCYLNENQFYQLKNINGVCYFFDKQNYKCKIYKIRPKGCQFYPLVYDVDKKKCVLDRDCPNPRLIYQDQDSIFKTCKHVKEYLKKELELKI